MRGELMQAGANVGHRGQQQGHIHGLKWGHGLVQQILKQPVRLRAAIKVQQRRCPAVRAACCAGRPRLQRTLHAARSAASCSTPSVSADWSVELVWPLQHGSNKEEGASFFTVRPVTLMHDAC